MCCIREMNGKILGPAVKPKHDFGKSIIPMEDTGFYTWPSDTDGKHFRGLSLTYKLDLSPSENRSVRWNPLNSIRVHRNPWGTDGRVRIINLLTSSICLIYSCATTCQASASNLRRVWWKLGPTHDIYKHVPKWRLNQHRSECWCKWRTMNKIIFS